MRIEDIFSGIAGARIGVLGDFCLDAYWYADMRKSELSRETPHFPLPIVRETYSPGAAGNVAANLAALKPASVKAFGVIGRDWRGVLLKEVLTEAGVDVSGLLESADRNTTAFIKPMRMGISDVVYEDPRLDFENTAPLSEAYQERLLQLLDEAELDVLCVCDQTRCGCITPVIRSRLSELGKKGLRIIADSRDHIDQYRHVIVKPNEVEAARAFGEGSYEEIALRLSRHTQQTALITLGAQGCLVCDGSNVHSVPACPVEPPIDICGAGDTFLSAFAAALAAGATEIEAASFANAASAVTIKKLNTTGTATREEIRKQWHMQ